MSWFKSWFGYGLGAWTVLFGEGKSWSEAPARRPIKQQTEAEIVAGESPRYSFAARGAVGRKAFTQ